MLPEFLAFLWLSFLSFHAIGVVAYQIVIVQEWLGSSLPSFQQAGRAIDSSYLNVYNYTLSHGYDYKLVDVDRADMENGLNVSKSWAKVFAIRELLRSGDYDFVVFIGSNFFIQRPEIPLTEVMKRWHGFADVYIAREVDVISRLKFTTTEDNEEEIDGSWNGGFQIWKNTMKNRDLLERWMVSTRKELHLSIWKKQSPSEMGSFAKDILPSLQENHFYHAIEIREGMDTERFIGRLNRLTIVQNEGFVSSNTAKFSSKDNNDHLPFSDSFFLNISDPLEEYRLFPECYIFLNYVMKDIDNVDYHFSMNFGFQMYILSESIYQLLSPRLINFCEHERINRTECNKMITYAEDLQRVKEEELHNHNMHSFYRNFIKQNPNFFQDRQPALPPRKDIMNAFPRTIVTIFAGRRDRIAVLMKYLKLALSLNIIQEVHLWDYCKTEEDQIALMTHINPTKSIFLRTRSTNRPHWYDYYEYYDTHRLTNPNDIIIKCDDDVVFIDVFKLPYFLSRVREEDELLDGVLFANIINNGVTAHYQQSLWNLLPKDVLGEFEYPEGGLCGSLWSSGETATKLHNYFLNHWEEIIRSQEMLLTPTDSIGNTEKNAVYYEPEFIPILTRFSINFFAIQAKNWYKIKDIGSDDEFHLTKSLPKYDIMKNYLSSNFFVSHLSFSGQNLDMNITRLLNMYDSLYEDYVGMKYNLFQI